MARVKRSAVHGTYPKDAKEGEFFYFGLTKPLMPPRSERNQEFRSLFSESESFAAPVGIDGVPIKRQRTLISSNIVHYIETRRFGRFRHEPFDCNISHSSRHLIINDMFHEHCLSINGTDKIFSCIWYNDTQFIMGTKTNLLLNYDIRSKTFKRIRPAPSPNDGANYPRGGIHSIAMDVTGTRFAASGVNSNEVAIYTLPDFKPTLVGRKAHREAIFDICWAGDDTLLSCSRDGVFAVWKDTSQRSNQSETVIMVEPVVRQAAENSSTSERLRGVVYNPFYEEAAVLSLNGALQTYDARSGFMKRYNLKLPHKQDNVCLTISQDSRLYAVGSRSHVSLIDARMLQAIQRVVLTSHHGCRVRSIQMQNDFFSVGTGNGLLLFWDIRAGGFFKSATATTLSKQPKTVELKTSTGEVFPEPNPGEPEYRPAIYTHSFDSSGCRIVTAGGPLNLNQRGSYLAIWQ